MPPPAPHPLTFILKRRPDLHWEESRCREYGLEARREAGRGEKSPLRGHIEDALGELPRVIYVLTGKCGALPESAVCLLSPCPSSPGLTAFPAVRWAGLVWPMEQGQQGCAAWKLPVRSPLPPSAGWVARLWDPGKVRDTDGRTLGPESPPGGGLGNQEHASLGCSSCSC